MADRVTPGAHRADRPGRDRAGRPGHHALPAGRRSGGRPGAGGAARARLRRHQGDGRADAEELRRPRLRGADLDGARASAAAAGRSTSTAPTRRSRTLSGCSTGWPRGPRSAPTPPATRGSAWSAARTAARWRCCSPAHDQRVDAIVPMITWNDLATAFLPEATGAGRRPTACSRRAGPGCSSAAADARQPAGHRRWPRVARAGGAGPGAARDPPAAGSPPTSAPRTCGSPRPGRPTQEAVALLRASSPAAVLDRIKAPTLLIQGEADSLFPLAEADANARGIAANGTPVRVAWFTGGHDGGDGPQTDSDRLTLPDRAVARPLRQGRRARRRRTASPTRGSPASTRTRPGAGRRPASRPPTYPGLAGTSTPAVPVAGPPQPVANPPGGNPAAISSLPGAGGARLAGGRRRSATSPASTPTSTPRRWPQSVDVVGAPTVRSGPRRRPVRRCSSSSSTTSTRTARATLPGRPGRAGTADRPAAATRRRQAGAR